MSTPYVTRLDGPAPERDVARDLVKKGIIASPILIYLGVHSVRAEAQEDKPAAKKKSP